MDDLDNTQIQWQKIRWTLLCVGILLLLILLAFYGPIWRRQSNPQKAYLSYNRYLVEKNYEAAFQMLCSETREAGNLDGFGIVQQGYIEKYGELRGFEPAGEMDTHLPLPGMVAFHEVLLYKRNRVRFILLLKKSGLFWRVWGFVEE